ncbi:RidA family protein [Epibacterium sp. MM17-32]|jgi:enamine deaminase RidA (YjgF/YER057c/UK114 family)|uniref:RidA family protein n=1 Tax=Epibacterium sp. MM17-32 TaxID=2917734 RepID=UPI001EF5DEAA|nr:RidA family protein [Epibacterium sp. MM17-32]MCG7626852.1 RidA family protein [Epibacterium sp. MM17-32]
MKIVRHPKGSEFEKEIGYARLVTADRWIFVSGTTGYNYATMEIEPEVEKQAGQCLENIGSALASVGASLQDVVRVNYYLKHAEDFPACWPILSKTFGAHPPAATMIEASLAVPDMLIEIEVTALQPDS